MGFFLRVGSIYSLKEKAQTSMEQDGSGCIGVVATRVKQDNWLVLNTDLIYHMKVHAVIFPHLFAWLRVQ